MPRNWYISSLRVLCIQKVGEKGEDSSSTWSNDRLDQSSFLLLISRFVAVSFSCFFFLQLLTYQHLSADSWYFECLRLELFLNLLLRLRRSRAVTSTAEAYLDCLQEMTVSALKNGTIWPKSNGSSASPSYGLSLEILVKKFVCKLGSRRSQISTFVRCTSTISSQVTTRRKMKLTKKIKLLGILLTLRNPCVGFGTLSLSSLLSITW